MFFKFLILLVCLGAVWAQSEAEAQTDESHTEQAETEEPQPNEEKAEEAETDKPTSPAPSSPAPPNTCDQQVLELLGQLEAAANESAQQASTAASTLETSIAVNQNEIKSIVEGLGHKARQAVNEKTASCKVELDAALAELNEGGSLGSCYEVQSLNIQSQASLISNLKVEASQVCSICGYEVEQNSCVQNSIANIVERAKGLQNDIAAQIRNVQAESAECSQNAKNDAANSVNIAAINLDACLQSA